MVPNADWRNFFRLLQSLLRLSASLQAKLCFLQPSRSIGLKSLLCLIKSCATTCRLNVLKLLTKISLPLRLHNSFTIPAKTTSLRCLLRNICRLCVRRPFLLLSSLYQSQAADRDSCNLGLSLRLQQFLLGNRGQNHPDLRTETVSLLLRNLDLTHGQCIRGQKNQLRSLRLDPLLDSPDRQFPLDNRNPLLERYSRLWRFEGQKQSLVPAV